MERGAVSEPRRPLQVNPDDLKTVKEYRCRGCGKRAPWCSCGKADYQDPAPSRVAELLDNLERSVAAARAAKARPRSCPECGAITYEGCGNAWHDGAARGCAAG